MRVLLIALIAAISYAQTETPSRLTSSQIPSINETPLDCDESLCCCDGSDVCDVADVSYNNNELSGRSCESVRGLVSDEICPPGLAAQCPKTCGQCSGPAPTFRPSHVPSVDLTHIPTRFPTTFPSLGSTTDETTCVDDNDQIQRVFGVQCVDLSRYGLCGQIHEDRTIGDICPLSCNICNAAVASDPTLAPNFSTARPSKFPSIVPSSFPSIVPTKHPSMCPTSTRPSMRPTIVSTTAVILDKDPTFVPTGRPSIGPTFASTTTNRVPSIAPVYQPTTPLPSTYPTTSLTDSTEINSTPIPTTYPTTSLTDATEINSTPIPTKYPTISLTDATEIKTTDIPPNSQSTTFEIETTRIETRDVIFDGDYDIVVGSNKDSFLQECSESLSPVSCIDVSKGSIIVTIQGSESDVNQAINDVEQNGLSLQSFGTLEAQITTTLPILSDANNAAEEDDGLDIVVIGAAAGGVVILLFCCCFAYWYFTVRRMKHEVSWMDEDHVVTVDTEKRNLKQLKPSKTQEKYLEETRNDNGMRKTPLTRVRTFTTDDELVSYQRKTMIQETSVGGLLIDGPELPEQKHAPEPYGLGANLAPNAFHKKFLAAESWMTEGSSESVSMRVDMQNIQKRYPGMSRLERSGDDLLTQTGSLPKTRSFGGDNVLVEDDFQKRMPITRSFGGDDLQLPAITERYQDSSPI